MDNKKQITKYPRNLAKSELLTKKSIDNTKVSSESLSRDIYTYSARYGFLMDGLTYFITDVIKKGIITERIADETPNDETGYYYAELTPQELEDYCIGEFQYYRKDNKRIIHDIFQTAIKNLTNSQNSLLIYLGKGEYSQGLPITIEKRLKEVNTNSKGAKISNLKNQLVNQDKVLITDYYKIRFWKPIFKDVVMNEENWIPIDKYFQAILTWHSLEYPDMWKFYALEEEDENHHYTKRNHYTILPETARKYFLYCNDHDNDSGSCFNFDAIDLFSHISPSDIEIRNNIKRVKYPYKCKYAVDKLVNIHSDLSQKGHLGAFRFTCKKSFFDLQTKQITIKVQRKKDVEQIQSNN